jgi:CHASE3 domain sensor protein
MLVFALVLAVAMLGATIGYWSLYRVSNATEHMVRDVMSTERMAGDLQRHILVNVARSKAFALSSEPQVGEALMPEINQTTQQIDALLQKLGSVLTTSGDVAILARMTQANTAFTKARQELTVARDGGVTANIEKVYAERFTPAATALQEAVKQLRM